MATCPISYKTDEAGNVYEKTNRLNEITRYTPDNANRTTRVDYLKDSTAETFGYDAAGNRNAAANGLVGYTFTYDRLNRLTTKLDSRGKNLAFTFDKVGNILTKTTYQGSTTSYVYNAANRLVMLRNPDYTQVDYQYDPAGRLLSRVTAAGARTSYLYDANGWLNRLTQYDAANTQLSDTATTRDRIGNILSQATTGGANPGTSTYTVDALYRLSTADYPGTANDELFTYDKVGNRKTYTKGSLTANANTRYYNYTAGSNRLAEVRIGSAAGTLESGFTNDFEGRLTTQTGLGAKTLNWDAKGRVKTVGTEGYQYDPMDYRIGRTGGAIGNRSYFLEGEHLESEYADSTLQAKYFRGTNTDELVAGFMLDTDGKTKPYLFHQDGVTSTTAVSGHNGGAIQQTNYSAFGQTQATTGSSPNRQKYTGREDDGNGLMYYRARYYDAALGRFISEDPMGFGAGDVNFYQYTSNNPINANDPSGHVLNFAIGAGTSVVLGGLIRYGMSGGDWNAVLDTRAIAIDAALGAVGVGVASKFKSVAELGARSNLAGRAEQILQAVPEITQTRTTIAATRAIDSSGNAVTIISSSERALRPAQRALLGNGEIAAVGAGHAEVTGVNAATSAGLTPVATAASRPICSACVSFLDDAGVATASPLKSGAENTIGLNLPALTSLESATAGAGISGGYNAMGGFLIYPNKTNTNNSISVYAK